MAESTCRAARAPERATLPSVDRAQYVTGWPSGYGTREAATYLAEQARESAPGITVARLHYEDQAKQGIDV